MPREGVIVFDHGWPARNDLEGKGGYRRKNLGDEMCCVEEEREKEEERNGRAWRVMATGGTYFGNEPGHSLFVRAKPALKNPKRQDLTLLVRCAPRHCLDLGAGGG